VSGDEPKPDGEGEHTALSVVAIVAIIVGVCVLSAFMMGLLFVIDSMQR
jgi:hypothetical protein